MSDYVYFVQSVHGGPIKIGLSNDPQKRLSTLQTAYPQELKIIYLIECNSRSIAEGLEQALHERFNDSRKTGEWFDITIYDVRREIEWARVVTDAVSSRKIEELEQQVEYWKLMTSRYELASSGATPHYSLFLGDVLTYGGSVQSIEDWIRKPFMWIALMQPDDIKQHRSLIKVAIDMYPEVCAKIVHDIRLILVEHDLPDPFEGLI